MAIERIIGVDFGTSTSVIRVKRYENGKPVGSGARLDTQKVSDLVPTVIQEMNGHRYYGEEALTPKGRNAIIYRSFKVDLESTDEEKREQARKLTEKFMAYLAAAYKTDSEGGHLGDSTDKERTIISYPVKWSDATKAFMLEAARKAGFPNVEGMDEAQAAINAVVVQNQEMLLSKKYLQEDLPATILLIDMGAGTTDLVLCRYTPGKQPKNEILATWPKDGNILFGGQEVDELLRNFATELFEDKTQAEFVLKRIPLEQFKAWKETEVAKLLANNETVEQFYTLDDLADMAGVALKPYNLDRMAFESCAESYLKQFPELVNGCLQSAEITGEQVDLVVLTGGHSQWYFAKDILAGKMPQVSPILLPQIALNRSRIVQVAHPQETAALGLVYSGFFNDNDEFSPEVVTELLNTNPTEAREYLRKYAEQGVAVAQWNYADCFWFAVGGERDIKAAHSWYKKAAEQGIAEAFLGLANIHFTEKDKEHYDLETATEYLKKAADLGHVPAQFALACTYSRSERYDKALKYFEMAAEQGHISAQYFTGYQYYIGYGTKVDFSAAIKWLRKTIENPNEGPNAVDNPTESKIGALKLLGDAYEHGKGVPVDRDKANTYYRQAKELEGLAEDEAAGSKQENNKVLNHYRRNIDKLVCVASLPDRDGKIFAVTPDGELLSDNRSVSFDSIHDIAMIARTRDCRRLYYLKKDGTVGEVSTGVSPEIEKWSNITTIACGQNHIVGLCSDGTVQAFGVKASQLSEIQRWRDIVSIACGNKHTVAIDKYGRVFYAGEDVVASTLIHKWTEMVQIACGDDFTVGLNKNGGIDYAVENGYYKKEVGQELKNWNDIASVCCSSNAVVALKKNGTVAACEVTTISPSAIRCTREWCSIVKIATNGSIIAGLTSDGTVVSNLDSVFHQKVTSDWQDMVAIFSSNIKSPEFGLKYTRSILGGITKGGEIRWLEYGYKKKGLLSWEIDPNSLQNKVTSWSLWGGFEKPNRTSDTIIWDDMIGDARNFDMSDIDL